MSKALLFFTLFALQVAARAQVGDAKDFLDELFRKEGPKVGDKAPDFTLEKATGGKVRASDLWAQKPLVVVTGSYTCPQFREAASGFEALIKEFGSRVNFVTVYTLEAHPVASKSPYFIQMPEMVTLENRRNGVLLLQPPNYEERKDRARKCRAELKLEAEVAVDTMDNATWRAYGRSPNCGYLIGRDGRVVLQQGLLDPDEMRTALAKLLEAVKDKGKGKSGHEVALK